MHNLYIHNHINHHVMKKKTVSNRDLAMYSRYSRYIINIIKEKFRASLQVITYDNDDEKYTSFIVLCIMAMYENLLNVET